MFACLLSDILSSFAKVEIVIMGDVTYGACCVDDFTATALGCEFLVHYGHSCLVPTTEVNIPTLYVFVDIGIDILHFAETVEHNFEKGKPLVLVGTIQFANALQIAKPYLKERGYEDLYIPQSKPLSPGELLGCTSPKIHESEIYDTLIYLG